MSDNVFSSRELDIMALAWHCFDVEPKVNYQHLAQLTGMTNTGSAYNAWTKIKKKLAAHRKLATSTSTPRSTKANTGKRTASECFNDEFPNDTPCKRRGGAQKTCKARRKLDASDGNQSAQVKSEDDGVDVVRDVNGLPDTDSNVDLASCGIAI